MDEYNSANKEKGKAILVALSTRYQDAEKTKEYLDELSFLVSTVGAVSIKSFVQKANRPDTKTFVGKGKLLEITDPSKPYDSDEALLFSLRSNSGVYTYLERVRNMEGCKHAWLFGDQLHVTLHSKEDVVLVKTILDGWGDSSIEWHKITPSVEDRFMGLIEQESREQLNNGETI